MSISELGDGYNGEISEKVIKPKEIGKKTKRTPRKKVAEDLLYK